MSAEDGNELPKRWQYDALTVSQKCYLGSVEAPLGQERC